jgi:hypothetical protein
MAVGIRQDPLPDSIAMLRLHLRRPAAFVIDPVG